MNQLREWRNWRIWSDSAAVLIRRARKLYLGDAVLGVANHLNLFNF